MIVRRMQFVILYGTRKAEGWNVRAESDAKNTNNDQKRVVTPRWLCDAELLLSCDL